MTLEIPPSPLGQIPKGEWPLAPKVRDINQQEFRSQLKRRELGVTWRDLTVEVLGSDTAINHNVLSQFNFVNQLRLLRHKPANKVILKKSHGCVKPGEMLLVLGRPGAGCTTLLKLLANRRHGFASISGDIKFGTMDHTEAAKYQGQIVMNTEDEIFFPTLTVGDTIDFATRMKIPFHRPKRFTSPEEYRQDMKDFLLCSMGISHTADTKVGNEYVRGVSGGERKRVSIIECMATRGSVFCWDNSTRGLDASTALDWAKGLRAMTDTFGLATIVTLYQAGNGIYDCFDKVLVLDEGEQIFYGPMNDARPFVESMGFICRNGANVADYLTGITVPTEREIRPECENTFPCNAANIHSLYKQSSIYGAMSQEEVSYPKTPRAAETTATFQEAVSVEKHSSLSKQSLFTVSVWNQIIACIIRQYQIIWNDKATFLIKQISALVQALVAGSLVYNASPDSTGLFIKSGSVFFAILYNGILTPVSEVTDSFAGCDVRSPCAKCRAGNKICAYTKLRKPRDRIYPPGYVEILEKQQEWLTQALEELYYRYTTTQEPQSSSSMRKRKLSVNAIFRNLGILDQKRLEQLQVDQADSGFGLAEQISSPT